MGQWIVEGVPEDEVVGFCKLQKATGATDCIPTPQGDGTSNILVIYPDKQTFADHKATVNQ